MLICLGFTFLDPARDPKRAKENFSFPYEIFISQPDLCVENTWYWTTDLSGFQSIQSFSYVVILLLLLYFLFFYWIQRTEYI